MTNDIFQKISRSEAVNVQFTDITYRVEEQSSKVIVNGVSGEFRAGELTAIIGPSGSGKTTLLNLLAGYRIRPSSGQIFINGKLQNPKSFRKITRYVSQEDHIRPHFTVRETMMMATKFKLGPRLSEDQRQCEVNELLNFFHLQEQANTRMSKISGGERKRVCVALELINNPAVIFLDEPTTGLDEFAAFQCVMVLKKLAMSGYTVICSIHSPSYRLFQLFDHVYTLAEGQCIYQGTVSHIVRYLDQFDCQCPITYNPADFIIEAATHVYGNFHDRMVQKINNGKIVKWSPDTDVTNKLSQYLQHIFEASVQYKLDMDVDLTLRCNECDRSASLFWEFKWLLERNIQQMWRDKTNLCLTFSVHIFLAFIIGYAYDSVGSNAKIGIYNYHMLLVTVVFCVFLSMSPVIPFFSMEMKYLRREHFNRWYRLSSYFMAVLTYQLLILAIMAFVDSALIYYLSDQPKQLFRFLLYVNVVLLTSMVSSSFGLFVGSRLNLVNALFISPCYMGICIMLANYATERPYLSIVEKIIMYSSCLRYALEGLVAALFGYDRANLICPSNEFFCLMSRPKFLLKIVGCENLNYVRSVLCLIGFYVIFSVLAFVNIRQRLFGKRLSHHQFKYIAMRYLCWRKC